MRNDQLVSAFLNQAGLYPAEDGSDAGGLCLTLEHGQLLLGGSPSDLIDLADLLVSLALSGESRGQHWHLDELNGMDPASPVPELVLLRK